MVLSVTEFTKKANTEKVKETEIEIEEIIDDLLNEYSKNNIDDYFSNDTIISLEETKEDITEEGMVEKILTSFGSLLNSLNEIQRQLVRNDIVKKYKKAGWDISWSRERPPYAHTPGYCLKIKGILVEE